MVNNPQRRIERAKRNYVLQHGDVVVLEGRKGYVGSVEGMAFADGENVYEAVQRSKKFGHELFWLNKAATVICSDKGHYEREDAKYAEAPKLQTGDVVMLDGTVLEVRFIGEYSDMGRFTPVM